MDLILLGTIGFGMFVAGAATLAVLLFVRTGYRKRAQSVPKWMNLAIALSPIAAVGGCAMTLVKPYYSAIAASGRTACAQNIRQIALGLLMYASDHDDNLPPKSRWADHVDPYVHRDMALFACPNDAEPFSYGLNGQLPTLSDLSGPSETVMVFEMDSANRNAVGGSADVATRDHPGTHVGHADGTVRFSPLERITELRWHPTYTLLPAVPAKTK